MNNSLNILNRKIIKCTKCDRLVKFRKKIADVTKTAPGVKPDKSGVLFKISVHNEEGMKKFVTGQNPVGKPIYDECVESIQVWELSPVKL